MIGAMSIAVRAASDEMRAAKNDINHVRQAIRPVTGTAARSTPSDVATPLPPLNLSQMGKQWPIIAPRPNVSALVGSAYKPSMNMGSAPLAASSRSVARASFLLPVRRTLVAPILPEPMARKSVSPKMRVRINPNGTDPAR